LCCAAKLDVFVGLSFKIEQKGQTLPRYGGALMKASLNTRGLLIIIVPLQNRKKPASGLFQATLRGTGS
jgi:hypothetical protein